MFGMLDFQEVRN